MDQIANCLKSKGITKVKTQAKNGIDSKKDRKVRLPYSPSPIPTPSLSTHTRTPKVNV